MKQYKTYQELDAWLKARELVKNIYLVTKNFPKEEIFGLAAQIRRCAVSVPSNIAEGYGRQYKKETIHFFYIARGSLYELETQIIIATDLLFIPQEVLNDVIRQIEHCRKLLSGLIKYFENNTQLK
ncbi:MAG: four helix bundle protein [Chitinophagaceae bacterium]|nr:four helix bundle protein [Chitinophagaceae bacterium]